MIRAAVVAAVLLLVLPRAVAGDPAAPPDHPRDLEYPPLEWAPPDPAAHRVGGPGPANLVLYVVEEPSLPLATFAVHFPVGTAGDPLAGMALALLLEGGAGERTGTEIRRAVETLGGRISIEAGRESTKAEISVFPADLPTAVDLLADVIRRPAFLPAEIERFREERRDAFRRRNDDVGAFTARLFRELALGADHPFAAEATPADFAAVDREALRAFAGSLPSRGFVATLAGRIPDREAVVRRVRERFGSADVTPPAAAPELPAGTPGLFLVDRPGATQGNVRVGVPAMPESHPDFLAFEVMNHVLGGSGFPSRITKRVRSDEGLAYSVGSRIDTGSGVAGAFYVGFQTRSPLVPFALRLVMDELARMRAAGVTDAELAGAKAALIERLPARFETPEGTADAFAELMVANLPPDRYSTYAARVGAITKEDVLRVAREWLPAPEAATIVVVGDAAAILAGDPTGAHPERLSDFGEVVRRGEEAPAGD